MAPIIREARLAAAGFAIRGLLPRGVEGVDLHHEVPATGVSGADKVAQRALP